MTKRKKSKLYILCIRDKSGCAIDLHFGVDYNDLLLRGMESADRLKGYWEIFDADTKVTVDGSLLPRLEEKIRRGV